MQPDLEARLNFLENQLKRQKQTTLALFVAATVAISATRVVSQQEARDLTLRDVTFRDVTVRSLRIVGKDGRARVLLDGEATNPQGGAIAVFDAKGNVRVGLMAGGKGGQVSILREDGEPMAILGFDGQGGSLGLSAPGSKTQVNLAATKNVSGMVVSGPSGKPQIVAGADKSGGVVQLYDVGGKLKQQLP